MTETEKIDGHVEYLYRLSNREDWFPESEAEFCREDYIRVSQIFPLSEFGVLSDLVDVGARRWDHFGLPREMRRGDIVNVRLKNPSGASFTMPVVSVSLDGKLLNSISAVSGKVGLFGDEESDLSLLVSTLRWPLGVGEGIGL